MARRIFGDGLSPNGVRYTASIYDITWGGAETEVDLLFGGIKIEYKDEKPGDPLFPIMGSSCTIDILADSSATLNTFFDDIRLSKEGQFLVEITADGGDYTTLWRGIVTPDTVTNEIDEGARYTVSLSATCGLGLLKTVPYLSSPTSLYSGYATLVKHLANALGKLAHVSTFWGATDPFIETSADWWEVSMTSGGANDPLKLSEANHAAFYDYFTKGGLDKDVHSCYDVIANICSSFGCRILMRGGMYVVEQIDYRANNTYEYRRYDKSANATSNSSHTGVITVNQTKTSGAKLSFVEYDFIPQLTKAKVTHLSKLRRNVWGNIFPVEGQTFNFDVPISSNSGAATLRASGLFQVNIKNNTYSGNPQDLLIAEMRMFLKIGSNYLKRQITYSNFQAHYGAMTWTANAGDTCAMYSNAIQVPISGLSTTFFIPFDFLTPALPSDGAANQVSATFFQLKKNDGSDVTESEFTITWTAGSMWLEVFDSGTPDVQEDEVLYEATNPDGGTDVWETEVLLGGGGSVNYAGRLINAGGSGLALWGQGAGARDKALGALTAKRAVDGRLRPKKRLNGDIYANNINPRKLLSTSDSIKWLHERLVWRPTENILSGTWRESDYGTTGAAATPIKVKIIKGGANIPSITGPLVPFPTTGGGQGLTTNNPAAALSALSFNTISSPIVKDATTTSIPVNTALEGNEFLSGDVVTLVHPATGQYQDFTVSATPAPGATSIAVSSVAALFDAPPFTGVFIKQKAFNYTPEQAQDDVLGIFADTSTIDFTYDDATPAMSAIVKDNSIGTAKVIDNNITLAKLLQIATASVLGRTTAGTGNVEVLTAAQTTAILDVFTSTLKGLVPASGGGTTNFLRADGTWAAASGGVADGDKGDITVSAGGATWTIDNDVVTFAKMQNISTDKLLGRDTAGTGDVEQIGVDSSSIEFDGTGNIRRAALTGDVTAGAGSSLTTIEPGAVTYSKIQNISAASRLLGRGSAGGAGNTQEITLGTGLSMTGTTLAATGTGDINQGGNSFGAEVVIGSNDNNAVSIETNNTKRLTISSGATTGGDITADGRTANTSTAVDRLIVKTNSTGVAADGFGGAMLMQAESSTTENRDIARILWTWVTAADATRAGMLAFHLGNNGGALAEIFKLTALRGTLTSASVATGANNAWLNLNANGALVGTTEALRMSGSLSTELIAILTNSRNVGNTGSTKLVIEVGGTAADDPYIEFNVPGGTRTVLGVDNSNSDYFKITPGGDKPGSIANKGIILSSHAVSTNIGINKDAPTQALDVAGNIMGVQYRQSANLVAAGNIAFGNGAGTGPVINSISGSNNGFQITFTTGTGPVNNGDIFVMTYPNAFGTLSYVVFSPRGNPAGNNVLNELAKFNVSAAAAATFTFKAVGTLTASTQYGFSFIIQGY